MQRTPMTHNPEGSSQASRQLYQTGNEGSSSIGLSLSNLYNFVNLNSSNFVCLLCLFATDIDSQSFRHCLSSIFIRLWLIRTRIPRMRNLRASEELHPGPAIVLNGASRLSLAQPLWDMGKPCCTMDRVLPVLGTFSFGSPSKPIRFLCFLSRLWLR